MQLKDVSGDHDLGLEWVRVEDNIETKAKQSWIMAKLEGDWEAKMLVLYSDGVKDKAKAVFLVRLNAGAGVVHYQDCSLEEARERVKTYLNDEFINYIELQDYNGYDWEDIARSCEIEPEDYPSHSLLNRTEHSVITYHWSSSKEFPPFVLYHGLSLDDVKKISAKKSNRLKQENEKRRDIDQMEFPMPDDKNHFFYEGAEFIRVAYKLPEHGALVIGDLLPIMAKHNIKYTKSVDFTGGDISRDLCMMPLIVDNKKLFVLFDCDIQKAMKSYLLSRTTNEKILRISSITNDEQDEQQAALVYTDVEGEILSENNPDLMLFCAAQEGNKDQVEKSLGQGAKLNCYDQDKNNALHIALIKGHLAVSEMLLMNIVTDINLTNGKGQSYLYLSTAIDYSTALDESARMIGKRIVIELLNRGVIIGNRGTNLYLNLKLYVLVDRVIPISEFGGYSKQEICDAVIGKESTGFGVCGLITRFWLNCMWEHANATIEESRVNPFSQIINFVNQWDGARDLSESEGLLITPFAKWMVTKSLSNNERSIDNVDLETHIVIPVSERLSFFLNGILKENKRVLLLYPTNEFTTNKRVYIYHAVGLYFDKGQYHFYDTNQHGMYHASCDSIEKLSSILLRNIRKPGGEFPVLRFSIYESSQEPNEKPKAKLLEEYFEKIKAEEQGGIDYFKLLFESLLIKDRELVHCYLNKFRLSESSLVADDNTLIECIIRAILIDAVDVLQLLIERGLKPDLVIYNGYTLLHISALRGYTDLIKVFCQFADLNIQDPLGKTPLFCAVMESNIEIAALLLKAGADPNISRDDEAVPLMVAAEKGDDRLTELLLEAGANCDAVHSSGRTALDQACQNGHASVVKRLLKADARCKQSSNTPHFFKNYTSPRELASKNGHHEIVKIIDEHQKRQRENQDSLSKNTTCFVSDNRLQKK